MKKSFLYSIIFSLLLPSLGEGLGIGSLCVNAAIRKEYKNMKEYIKTSNYAKGREQIAKCLADTTINTDPEFYALAIALETKANDAENMKLYLNQKYDTASFFNSNSKIVEYSLMQDKAQNALIPLSENKRKKKAASLVPYYQNLFNGGVFFIKHKQWTTADRMFSMFINTSGHSLLEGQISVPMSKMARAAFWSMTACYESKQYKDVFKYHDLAEADTANINYVLQYEALAYEQMKDTANYVSKLKEGIAKNPTASEFFFSRLTDYYNSVHDYKAAYLLNDSLLRTDSTSVLYLYAQTIVLFNMKEYDKCISNTENLLRINPNNSDANYYLGLCWYNKGLDYDATLIPDPTSKTYKENKKKVNQMFEQAMPYLEKFRAARPDDKERWQAPLYRIYFSLNLSDQLKKLEE